MIFVGLCIGLLFGIILNILSMSSYKRILVMKAKDGTAEYINGRFYYIKSEN